MPSTTSPPSSAEVGRAELESLLEAVLPSAYGLARQLTRNTTEAEDLLQEAALQAYRGLATFTPGTSFKAWFFRILTNRHYYRYREARRRPVTVEIDDSPDLYLFARTAESGLHALSEDPARLLMSKMTEEQIRNAMAELPEEHRVVVALFFLEEMRYHEIGEIVGCPVGTVRSRLHRGRKMLQKRLWHIARSEGIVDQLTPAEASS